MIVLAAYRNYCMSCSRKMLIYRQIHLVSNIYI
nr:MAG TPA: hypothetical protein [Crassvirales sp.]